MKKLIILLLASIFIFTGCSPLSNDKKEPAKPDTKTEDKKVENNNSNTDVQKKDLENGTDNNSNPPIIDEPKPTDESAIPKVLGQVQLYEGSYFDSKRYGDDRPNPYVEIQISNIKKTMFDFAIYSVKIADDGTKTKEIIFLNNTAEFIEDGTKAAFYGKDYTIYFSFPNNHGASPIVTDIEATGFEPLEGKTFINNSIPGHEFG